MSSKPLSAWRGQCLLWEGAGIGVGACKMRYSQLWVSAGKGLHGFVGMGRGGKESLVQLWAAGPKAGAPVLLKQEVLGSMGVPIQAHGQARGSKPWGGPKGRDI